MILDDPMPAPGSAALAQAKAYLRIDGDAEDALIAALLASAAGLAERFTGQRLLERDVREALPACRAWRRLSLGPVRAIAGVDALALDGSAAALDPAGYAIDIDANGDGWVRTFAGIAEERVAVRATVGMASAWEGLPAPIAQGIVRLAAHLYAHRDAADDAGPPTAVSALWRPWRRMRLA